MALERTISLWFMLFAAHFAISFKSVEIIMVSYMYLSLVATWIKIYENRRDLDEMSLERTISLWSMLFDTHFVNFQKLIVIGMLGYIYFWLLPIYRQQRSRWDVSRKNHLIDLRCLLLILLRGGVPVLSQKLLVLLGNYTNSTRKLIYFNLKQSMATQTYHFC